MATQAEIAKHLDMSDRNVRELQARGVLPRGRKGELGLDDCRVAYVRYLREVAAGRRSDDDDAPDLTAERARLAREQADGHAIKNAALRRDLLPASDVSRSVVAAFTIVRDRLLSLPDRLAPVFARMTDENMIRDRLDADLHNVLAELSEVRVTAAVDENDDDDA